MLLLVFALLLFSTITVEATLTSEQFREIYKICYDRCNGPSRGICFKNCIRTEAQKIDNTRRK